MIYTCKPAKVAIYVNTARKSTAQIKTETGCTALINGGLYDMTTFAPVCHLKVDGRVLAKDRYRYWGFAWNDTPVLDLVQDYGKYKNYICCVCLVRDGQAEHLVYSEDLGGYRPRTAFGVFEDGRVWLYADAHNKLTPVQLQKLAIKAGVKHAIMLDGGGSTQGASPTEAVSASRRVHNYICVWAEPDPKKEVTQDMTEARIRQKVLDIATAWLGKNERDGSFKAIIDRYNRFTPLPVGYKVKYTDEWCATFVSAVFMEAGLTDIGFPECSCQRMIELYKAAGRWQENEAYTPKPGDVIMYDWQDSGVGDNTGFPDHVGIVHTVTGSAMRIIEGNRSGAVGYRTMSVNGKNIRGYCLPDYGSKADAPQEPVKSPTAGGETTVTVNLPQLAKGAQSEAVRALQQLLTAKGYNTRGTDGIFGANTDNALRSYQKAMGLTADGICGKNTWTALLTK